MQKIIPFLWFNDNAEEAVNFYISVFKNSRIEFTTPGPEGRIMSAKFILEGEEFIALNGGPMFKFTPAISLFVNCETQAEVDELWDKLSEGGEKQMCGWLQDKYGISWQIIPTALERLLYNSDPSKSQNVLKAMLQMKKIEIDKLEEAYAAG